PLFHTAKQFAANFWTPVTVTGLLEFYSNLLLPVSLCLVALLVLLSLLPADPLHETSRKGLRASTLVVLVLFALLPLALFALANSLTGAFLPRYVYASGTAICLLVVYLINRLAVDPHHRLVVLAFVPLIFFAVLAVRGITPLQTERFRSEFLMRLHALQQQSPLPIVLGDDGLFVEISYYDQQKNHRDLANIWFVYDPQPDARTNVDMAFRGLKKIMPLNAIEYGAARSLGDTWLYLGPWGHPLLQLSIADCATYEFVHDKLLGLDYWILGFPDSSGRAECSGLSGTQSARKRPC